MCYLTVLDRGSSCGHKHGQTSNWAEVTMKWTQRLFWCQCVCTDPASLPKNPTEVTAFILLTLTTERIPCSFKEDIKSQNRPYIALIWRITTIILPSAVRICPTSSVGSYVGTFRLAFECRAVTLGAILVFTMSISVFSHCFDVKLFLDLLASLWISSKREWTAFSD